MPPTPARLNTSYRSPTARWTSARAGGCMREGNVAALAGRRTGPDNRGAMPDAPKLSLRVLGPARVTVGGAEAPPPPELLWRKHLALLVYLARSPRKSRTREHLVGLLWSDRDDKQARHSLSEALRVLRRVLGDAGVQADVDQVRLAADGVTLDCDRFAELAARGEWDAAAAFVEGEFLEGLSLPGANEFESWLGTERALWRALALDALVKSAEAALDRGDPAGAARAALRAAAFDPTSELAARAAMRALALAGDRAAALRAADALARALRRRRPPPRAPCRGIEGGSGAPSRGSSREDSRMHRGSRARRPPRSRAWVRSIPRWAPASALPSLPCPWATPSSPPRWRRRRSVPCCSRSTTRSGWTTPRSPPCPPWRVTARAGGCSWSWVWRGGLRREGSGSTSCGPGWGAISRARWSAWGAWTLPRSGGWPRGPGRRAERRSWIGSCGAWSATRRAFPSSPSPCSKPWPRGTGSRPMRPPGRPPRAP